MDRTRGRHGRPKRGHLRDNTGAGYRRRARQIPATRRRRYRVAADHETRHDREREKQLMEYPETLTAPLLLEHVGHALTVDALRRHGTGIIAAAIECQTCGDPIALEWTGGDTV
jgi:hypothetical protein